MKLTKLAGLLIAIAALAACAAQPVAAPMQVAEATPDPTPIVAPPIASIIVPSPSPTPAAAKTKATAADLEPGTLLPMFHPYDPRDAIGVWRETNYPAMDAGAAAWMAERHEILAAIGADEIERAYAAKVGRWTFERPEVINDREWRVYASVIWLAEGFQTEEWGEVSVWTGVPYTFVVDELSNSVVSATAYYEGAEANMKAPEWQAAHGEDGAK